MEFAKRIAAVPPYLFAQIDKKKAEVAARGVDIISLGIGDPDLPAPDYVVERMIEEVKKPPHHRYPDYDGALDFRRAAVEYYEKRFGVTADPKREVMTLIGSKEGLAHIIYAFIDPGDITLVPDPAYPVYRTHTLLAGGQPYIMPLKPENGFLPDLDAIPDDVARKAKLMFLNYPNNPTAAVADLAFFEKAVAFCKKYDIGLIHDQAYSEMTYDGYVAPSILQVPGAKDVAIEFWSLSKPFNMTGWRIAWAIGNEKLISGLGVIKTNTDSGQFTAIQYAGIEALRRDPAAFARKMNEIYVRRRDIAVEGFRSIGCRVEPPKGTFYLWVGVPEGYTSVSMTELILEKAGVVVVPGNGYGQYGEGFIRAALTTGEDRIREAIERIKLQVLV